MGEIDLGSLLAQGAVPDLGTDQPRRDQIEYIDIDQIDDDPRNFYSFDGLPELAANIELIGLQQPIRVRANPDAPGRVIIVSGHRRRAAIATLVKDGRDDLRVLPCIRETKDEAPALQELRLIYANSDTRKMHSSDINKQAARVETLLYELKEQGYEFPGRMRDHVAEACKVSKSKLSRLKVIRDGLDAVWQPSYDTGELSESTAYALAQLPPDHQQCIFTGFKSKNTQICWFYEHEAKRCGEKLAAVDKLTCKRGGAKGTPCANIEAKRKQAVHQSSYYGDTPCAKCCNDCAELAKCKNACPLLADKVKQLREDANAQRRQEAAAKAAEEAPDIERIQKLWRRFGEARTAAGKSVGDCFNAIGRYCGEKTKAEVRKFEAGTAKITPQTQLPYGNCCYLSEIKHYVNVADLLGCSLDYLLCRTDDPSGGAASAAAAANKQAVPADGCVPLQYLPATELPGKVGQQAVVKYKYNDEAKPVLRVMVWNGSVWCFPTSGSTTEAECIGWFPLPEEEA